MPNYKQLLACVILLFITLKRIENLTTDALDERRVVHLILEISADFRIASFFVCTNPDRDLHGNQNDRSSTSSADTAWSA